jgi:hypothetical protein
MQFLIVAATISCDFLSAEPFGWVKKVHPKRQTK